ncbi:hypothetical protein H8356DRAFT_310692 [Neocallimastix lanati (nom. inval.)]|nr:hypothetical protein H8356DRAFT_310692 [Neocallimastix sp. JGI-2020a]
MNDIYKNNYFIIILKLLLMFSWKYVKSKTITITNQDDFQLVFQNKYNNLDDNNEEFNYIFIDDHYSFTYSEPIQNIIYSPVNLIGKESKTVFDFNNFTNGLINLKFKGKNKKYLKFKNFIFKDYNNKNIRNSLFKIDEGDNDYQLIFQDCTFENNETVLIIYTYCRDIKEQKKVIFENCKFINITNELIRLNYKEDNILLNESICYELKISNCIFNNIDNVATIDYGNATIENSVFQNIHRYNNFIYKSIILTSNSPLNSITVSNSTFTNIDSYTSSLFLINSSELTK